MERTIEISKEGNIVNVTEKGSVTFYQPKSHAIAALWNAVLPSRAAAKTACNTFYLQNSYGGTLKNLKNSFTIPKFGKTVSYSYSFTDDEEVSDTGDFARKKLVTNDTLGSLVQSTFSVPNRMDLLHTPGQTNLGARAVNATSILRRPKDYNMVTNVVWPSAAIDTLKLNCLQRGYEVFIDNNLIRSNDYGAIYVNEASFSYNSKNELSMNINASFVMTRDNGENNLILK